MNDARVMRRIDRFEDRVAKTTPTLAPNRPALKNRRQGIANNTFHDQVVGAELDECGRERRANAAKRVGFASKPRAVNCCRMREHFQRDLGAVLAGSAPYVGKPAGSKFLAEAKPIGARGRLKGRRYRNGRRSAAIDSAFATSRYATVTARAP